MQQYHHAPPMLLPSSPAQPASGLCGQSALAPAYLPIAIESGDATRPERTLAQLPRGSERILLVEDEPSVRRLAARILRGLGYHVIEAINGEQALKSVTALEPPPDLLLTDVVMPALGGPALAEQLLHALPQLKVIFMSGYPHEQIERHAQLMRASGWLQKPFLPTALAQQIRQALDG